MGSQSRHPHAHRICAYGQVREALKGTPAEGVVTDADIVALVGAAAVRVTGGPSIALPLGRAVATSAVGDPMGRMPGEDFNAEQLKASFAGKGLNVQEMVVLSGGRARTGGKGQGAGAQESECV